VNIRPSTTVPRSANPATSIDILTLREARSIVEVCIKRLLLSVVDENDIAVSGPAARGWTYEDYRSWGNWSHNFTDE